ncbi:hypothetical protein WR25_25835 [Diploscapter pachys]|uniref:Glucosidase II subunit alpha n=1 Tax=Diploscapter pachys TaxID=2018661 RepID=A0A2A2JLZ8_9BILA|nr:hypothetical protein WR25_25835 [Diploscapter pachys]
MILKPADWVRMDFLAVFLFLIGISSVGSVNRHDFKTCDQSAFCKKHRAITENTGYQLLSNTAVKYSSSEFRAQIQNSQNKLDLRIFGIEDSTWRIQIDEPEGALRKRYVPELALNGIPKATNFKSVEIESDKTTITAGDGKQKMIIQYSPFVINVYNVFGDLVLQVNRDGKLKFEEFRKKEEGKEYPEGFWEETFKSNTDTKPHGSSDVGADISFIGYRHAFGLPEHADAFSLRTTKGTTDPFRLFNLDVFEYELHNTMALYVSIPYIVAHNANSTTGMLWLNSAETWVDTSSSESSKSLFAKVGSFLSSSGDSIPHYDAHFMSESGLVDIFVFTGPTPQDVQRQNAKLTGTTPLPPLFALAYHQCRWNYNDEKDVAEVNANFDKYDIPMDVIWLDIEHTDGKKYFTWDPNRFGTAKDMINNVASTGRKMVTIIDPHIKKDDNYYVYKNAKDKGLFVKRADGVTDYEGHCWPGASEYLDFYHPETRSYWKSLFSFDSYQQSTKDLFTWNDMNEPSVFSGPEITMHRDSIHYGGIEHREVHNMYGMMYTSASFDGLMARTDGQDRPFILSRAGFVGTQRTAAIWTGDNAAQWGHLEITPPMTLSLSIAGVPFIGSDVGGFFGNPDEQLLVRWYEAGAFIPFFRAHAHIDTRRREPWLFSEATRLQIRDAIRRRYALLPYWYTLFYEHTQDGSPPMRPIWYEFPKEEKLYAEHNAFMLGNAILVRPVLTADTYSVSIDLPQGAKWYDWETGAAKPSGTIYADAKLGSIPVYQRGGTIVPTWQRIRRASSLMKDDPYTLFVALDENGSASGEVYADDGTTHEYQKGQYLVTKFQYKPEKSNKFVFIGEPSEGGKYPTKNWIERIEVRGVKQVPQHIEIIRASDPTEKLEFTYDRDLQKLVIRKPAVSTGQSFQINLQF